jgi:hypothetical protein
MRDSNPRATACKAGLIAVLSAPTVKTSAEMPQWAVLPALERTEQQAAPIFNGPDHLDYDQRPAGPSIQNANHQPSLESCNASYCDSMVKNWAGMEELAALVRMMEKSPLAET